MTSETSPRTPLQNTNILSSNENRKSDIIGCRRLYFSKKIQDALLMRFWTQTATNADFFSQIPKVMVHVDTIFSYQIDTIELYMQSIIRRSQKILSWMSLYETNAFQSHRSQIGERVYTPHAHVDDQLFDSSRDEVTSFELFWISLAQHTFWKIESTLQALEDSDGYIYEHRIDHQFMKVFLDDMAKYVAHLIFFLWYASLFDESKIKKSNNILSWYPLFQLGFVVNQWFLFQSQNCIEYIRFLIDTSIILSRAIGDILRILRWKNPISSLEGEDIEKKMCLLQEILSTFLYLYWPNRKEETYFWSSLSWDQNRLWSIRMRIYRECTTPILKRIKKDS